MAEIVQLRIEHGVEELLELERAELFTSEEIRTVIKKRKHFEYRLQRQNRNKEDFLKYISYEQCLLKLVKIRRDKVGFTHRFKEIDLSIANKIALLFRQACFGNKSDVDLWLSYISFCKDMKWLGHVSKVYGQMLGVLNKQPELWVSAAKFEFDENHSMETARMTLMRGLRFCPDSKLLYRESFRLELLYVDKIVKRKEFLQQWDKHPSNRKRKRSEGDEDKNANDDLSSQRPKKMDIDDELNNDAILSGKVAMVIFESGVEKINDVSFALSFQDILDPFHEEHPQLVQNLEDEIMTMTEQHFPKSEVMQAAKIKKAVRIFSKETAPTPSSNQVIDKTIELYKNAMESIPGEKMWASLLTTLLEYMSAASYSRNTQRYLANQLHTLFQEAFQNSSLSSDLFMEWVFLQKAFVQGFSHDEAKLKIHLDKLMDIITKGTEKWSHNPAVWTASLSVLTQMSQSKEEDVRSIFERGLASASELVDKTSLGSIQEEALQSIQQFVVMFIEWSSKKELSSKYLLSILESLSNGKTFSLATASGRRLCSLFKTYLLEKSYDLEGLEVATQNYNKYKDHHPVTPMFFQSMIRITKHGKTSDPEVLDSIFEDYINEYGSSNHLIWIEYGHHLCDTNRVTFLSDLYTRAVKSLKGSSETNAFMERYSEELV